MRFFTQLFYTIAYKILLVSWFIFRPTRIGARCLILWNGKILLIKQSYMPQWRLPGGLTNRGEDLLQTAIREVGEECGITVSPEQTRLFGMYTSTEEYKSDHIALFVITLKDEDVAHLRIDTTEVIDSIWADPSDLPSDTSPSTLKRINEWRNNPTNITFTTW